MAHLRRFPVDVIKIDRSFTPGIAESGEAAALMITLIQVGQALGLETLAQGVEDDDQRAFLVRERCDGGQGFHFAKPLTPTALEDLLHLPSAHAPSSTPTAASAP
jgi:EAL domain-containing protein (putative c-di-GMP-specific phosphodiesterase class I)